MSTGTVVADRVQIGQSGTTAQKFSLEVPSTPNGEVKLMRGPSGATTSELLKFDSVGVAKLVRTGSEESAIVLDSDLVLATDGNSIYGAHSGSKRWHMGLGEGNGSANFVLENWNGSGYVGSPFNITWHTTNYGQILINNGLQAGNTAPVIRFENGTSTMIHNLSTFTSGGIYYGGGVDWTTGGFAFQNYTVHNPGVIAFWRVLVGGSQALDFNSSGQLSSPTGTIVVSDERVKTAFRTEDWRKRTADLWVGSYERTDNAGINAAEVGPRDPRRAKLRWLGVKAQDVRRRNPEAVFPVAGDADLPDKLGVDYGQIAVMALGLAKQLAAEVDSLKAELAALKAR